MPASTACWQNSKLFANLIPLVSACTELYPTFLAERTASRKYGLNVGSPPENCTLICRRGLMVMALSSMVLISSHVSSWTKPTWFASMKQGSHIMLQRLVRSMVSTEPRPYFTVEDP